MLYGTGELKMPDTVSQKRRSEIMSHIQSQNTSIELLVRKQLFAQGFRFRVNYKKLPGKPDIVFTRKKVAIFIHGCFWHGHDTGCRYSHVPQSRTEYWSEKISRTKERDKNHINELTSNGWCALTIWECEIRKNLQNVIDRIVDILNEG